MAELSQRSIQKSTIYALATSRSPPAPLTLIMASSCSSTATFSSARDLTLKQRFNLFLTQPPWFHIVAPVKNTNLSRNPTINWHYTPTSSILQCILTYRLLLSLYYGQSNLRCHKHHRHFLTAQSPPVHPDIANQVGLLRILAAHPHGHTILGLEYHRHLFTFQSSSTNPKIPTYTALLSIIGARPYCPTILGLEHHHRARTLLSLQT